MRLYNTLTRQKEEFVPIHPGRVNMFVCGPTVYDYSHVGHARTYSYYDTLAKYLRHKGHTVFYVMNITDVDDKIIKRAREQGIKPLDLARKYEKEFMKDMKALNINSVNLFPRASEHIPEIIEQVEGLLKKGYAYVTKSGNVYYDVSRFPDYGKLGRKKPEEMNVHRIEPDPEKRNPADFALWKRKEEEISWDSPWGRGRPGWHIEDTAITVTYFGPQYDIHGGAIELAFPHHEAEIAQAEAYTGKKPLVKYWVHTGLLLVEGRKMSKSLGNFVTIRSVLENHRPEALRLYFAMSHYRSEMDYSEKGLKQAEETLSYIYDSLILVEAGKGSARMVDEVRNAMNEFEKALDDDLNTPKAVSVLIQTLKKANSLTEDEGGLDQESKKALKEFVWTAGTILGILPRSVDRDRVISSIVGWLLVERDKARKAGDYEKADKIRDTLRNAGLDVKDTRFGTLWRIR